MATVSARLGRRHKPCSVCGKDHAPWWASNKGRWMLSVERTDRPGKYRQINLGDDHDKALAKWHRIEAGLLLTETHYSGPTTTGDSVLVGELAEAFIDRIEKKISQERFKITHRYINAFVETFGGDSVAKIRVGGVNRIESWLDAHKTWNGCRPDVVSRIKQLFNWSVKSGYIATSPVVGLEKPKYGQRVRAFTAEQIDAILRYANPHFSAVFRMLLLTGARPEEICSLTSKEVRDDESGFYLLVKHKNQKHTGKPRRVFLVPEAAAIVREQLKLYPTGRLFRSANKTSDGVRPPLSVEYVNNALRKLCEDTPELIALGLDEHEIVGDKRQYEYVAYTARHTFAVRYLTGFYRDATRSKEYPNGKPIILNFGEVAAFMGNTAAMVEKIYGHLVDQTKFLSDRLNGTR